MITSCMSLIMRKPGTIAAILILTMQQIFMTNLITIPKKES